MSFSAALRFDVFALSHCSSCCDLHLLPYIDRRKRFLWSTLNTCKFSIVKLGIMKRREFTCRVSEMETEPESNDEKNLEQLDSQTTAQDQDKAQTVQINALESNNLAPGDMEDGNNLEVASGSPLPGVKGGVLFRGNLRGKAAKSYEKITNRIQDMAGLFLKLAQLLMQGKFGDEYKLFLLISHKDDKPVAVVFPRKTLQPERTAKLLLGDAPKEGTPISVNPLVIWAWLGLLVNAIHSIPAGELDGGRIDFALWGRKVFRNAISECSIHRCWGTLAACYARETGT
ncbi:hypothetical protein RJ641_005662, partial [Dillenia turbinata]